MNDRETKKQKESKVFGKGAGYPVKKEFDQEKEALKQWEKHTNLLASIFIEKYYPDYIDDWAWIGDEVGHVVMVGDEFIDLGMMADAIRYSPTPDQFHDWYNSADWDNDGYRPMNLKNFVTFN